MDNSRLTQMTRNSVSRPTRWLVENVDFKGKEVLHHGRGKAVKDTLAMEEAGARWVTEYDPNVEEIDNPCLMVGGYDIVVSNFVLNVLPPEPRDAVVDEIFESVAATNGVAYIAVRTDKVNGLPVADGVLTSRGTFQTQLSVADWTEYFGRHPAHLDSGYAIFTIDNHG